MASRRLKYTLRVAVFLFVCFKVGEITLRHNDVSLEDEDDIDFSMKDIRNTKLTNRVYDRHRDRKYQRKLVALKTTPSVPFKIEPAKKNDASIIRSESSPPVNCKSIIEGESSEISRAHHYMDNNPPRVLREHAFISRLSDCAHFTSSMGYTYHFSQEESAFPIAYSILFYKNIFEVERLLRAIYRPTNVYCLHVDKDAQRSVETAAETLAGCFDNVFLVQRREHVIYAGFSRLQADINCMTELLDHPTKWKYFINLASQAFPLKTNLEIVKILKIYNGNNDIEGISDRRRMMVFRFEKHHEYERMPDGKFKLITTNKNKSPAPHGFKVVKGSAYGIFSRDLVNYIIHDRRAKDLLEWSRDVKSPDEYYWSTLNHNPQLGVPGSYPGRPDDKPWLAVYASWCCKQPCQGKNVRGVCIFGVGDLPNLISRKELFANKFHMDFQPLVLDCLYEWLKNKTRQSNVPFDSFYYRNLPFIKK